VKTVPFLSLLLSALLQPLCGAAYAPPAESALGKKTAIQVENIEWAAAAELPDKAMLYTAAPRPLDLRFVEALAQEYGIPKSKSIPEDMGPLGPGAASYEDYSQNAPRALYYQPATGTFVLGLDASGGFSTFAERGNDDWPGLPSPDEAYGMALALFPKVGLKPEEFSAGEAGRLYYTVSNKFLGWFDAKRNARRREPTTITLKFYRKIGDNRVASSGQGGCALFEFGPHKRLMSVEWRMRQAIPLEEVSLKGKSEVLSDIKGGRSYSEHDAIVGEALTVKSVELRPHEGNVQADAVFYPLYEVIAVLKRPDASQEVKLIVPAVR
jgi:hypothetical protein